MKNFKLGPNAIFTKKLNDLITIRIFNKVDLLIFDVDRGNEYEKYIIFQEETIVIFDPKFKKLKKILEGKISDSDFWYANLIEFVQQKTFGSKKLKDEFYDKLPTFTLKSIYADKYNLYRHPLYEWFFYSSDELSPRYRQNKTSINIEGQRVRLKGSDAMVFKKGKDRFIDCTTYSLYRQGNKGYICKDVKLVKCKKSESEFSRVKGKKVSYYKKELKKGVKLDDLEFYIIENYDNKIVTVGKDGDDYYLEDKKGKIRINHPDLLFEIV